MAGNGVATNRTNARWGAWLVLLLAAGAVVASLVASPAPVPDSAITSGREASAALADARLWAACRAAITWLSPLVVVAVALWLGAVEGNRTGRLRPWLPLAALWAFHGLTNILWLAADRRAPYWDMANHLWLSLRYYRAEGLNELWRIVGEVAHYPPLFHLATWPFYRLLGTGEDVAALVNLLALAVLLAATYGLGAHLYNRGVGLLGAFIVSMYPLVAGLSRKYLIDVMLMALVAASVWALARSEGLRRARYVILFGLIAALGMLTKRAFALYVAGPLLWAGIAFWRGKPGWRQVAMLALPALVVAASALPWYGLRLYTLGAYIGARLLVSRDGANLSRIGQSARFYLQALAGEQLFLFFTVLALVGLGYALSRQRRGNGLLLAWVGLSLALLSLVSTNDVRFAMPFFPALALFSANWLLSIRPSGLRQGLVALTTVAALAQHTIGAWGVAALPAPVNLPRQVAWATPLGDLTLYAERTHVAFPAQPWDWQVKRILADIVGDAGTPAAGIRVLVGVIPNRGAFEPGTFLYYAELAQLPIDIAGIGNLPDYAAWMERCDYIVAKSGDPGRAELNAYAAAAAAALRPDQVIGQRFRLMGEYALPDRSVVYVYERRN